MRSTEPMGSAGPLVRSDHIQDPIVNSSLAPTGETAESISQHSPYGRDRNRWPEPYVPVSLPTECDVTSRRKVGPTTQARRCSSVSGDGIPAKCASAMHPFGVALRRRNDPAGINPYWFAVYETPLTINSPSMITSSSSTAYVTSTSRLQPVGNRTSDVEALVAESTRRRTISTSTLPPGIDVVPHTSGPVSEIDDTSLLCQINGWKTSSNRRERTPS